MKMVARRAAGRADIADDVALFHMLARMDDEARHMAIARLDRVAMFDFDIIAIAAKALGAADGAVGGGVDGGAIGRRDINAVVARDPAGDRVDAHAVGGGERHFFERLARRHRNAEGRGQAGVAAILSLETAARSGFLLAEGHPPGMEASSSGSDGTHTHASAAVSAYWCDSTQPIPATR